MKTGYASPERFPRRNPLLSVQHASHISKVCIVIRLSHDTNHVPNEGFHRPKRFPRCIPYQPDRFVSWESLPMTHFPPKRATCIALTGTMHHPNRSHATFPSQVCNMHRPKESHASPQSFLACSSSSSCTPKSRTTTPDQGIRDNKEGHRIAAVAFLKVKRSGSGPGGRQAIVRAIT